MLTKEELKEIEDFKREMGIYEEELDVSLEELIETEEDQNNWEEKVKRYIKD